MINISQKLIQNYSLEKRRNILIIILVELFYLISSFALQLKKY